MSAADVDPLGVPCPRCEAGVGERCMKPSGEDAPTAHAPRKAAAEAAAAAALARAEGDAPDRIKGERWRRLYVAGRLELEQRGDWTTLAREQLETMVRTMAQADVCRGRCTQRPMVKGSQGQMVANPLWATESRLDSQALAVARALKLTPDTRGTTAAVGDDDVPQETDAEPTDALSGLDEVARKRKQKAAKPRRARAGA